MGNDLESDNGEHGLKKPLVLGIDIGGTKTAAVLGTLDGHILDRAEAPTPARQPFDVAWGRIVDTADRVLASARTKGLQRPGAISVAIGGPLDIERGIIESPPHLPTWDHVPLKQRLEEHYGLPVLVEHDGNAGALAEFYFGAGQGVSNLIYLTMGTGLGAGIILNGQIYHGISDAAGEVGHIRLSENGPTEYGKAGSFEGYCSGAGIVQMARLRGLDFGHREVTTRAIVEAALSGEPDAHRLIEEVGTWLGRGMGILVDILNPEKIVVCTLGMLLGEMLLGPARAAMRQEALEVTAKACEVVPARLGDDLSSTMALMAAIDAYHHHRLPLPEAKDFSRVLNSLKDGEEVHRRTMEELALPITRTAQLLVDVFRRGGKVLVCGNGGSAATAQHLAGELAGRFRADRSPLPAIALNADAAVITCIGNDYAFDEVFARQVRGLAQSGDLVIGITTSGKSKNVLRALSEAEKIGAGTIALTGASGLAIPSAGHVLAVPSSTTARVQEEHDAIIHAWCEVIDHAFTPKEEQSVSSRM